MATEPRFISRAETARILGKNKPSILRYHGKILHPKLVKGEWQYDRDEVDRAAAILLLKGRRGGARPHTNGELEREVFKAFHLGMTLADIVITFSVESKKVQEMYAEYMKGLKLPPPPEPTHAEKLAEQMLQFKIEQERNRIELARERLHLRRQRMGNE